jgi:hypothetical protein
MKNKTEEIVGERKEQHEVVQSSDAFPEVQGQTENAGSLARN